METMTRPADIGYVDPFPGRKGDERIFEECGFCLGTGVYQGKSGLTFYTPTTGDVDKGCFRCDGTGKHSYLVSSARATARRRAKADAEGKARSERVATEAEAFRTQHADELALLREYGDLDRFLGELRDTFDGLGELTEKQLAAIGPAVKRYKAREAAKRPVPTTDERLTVSGVVNSIKLHETPFGSSLKMVVQCEGFSLWGSVPSAEGGISEGDRVEFVARVEASARDESFGFFKRPTKARVTERAEAE